MPDYDPHKHPDRWLMGACSSGDPLRWAVVAVHKKVKRLERELATEREDHAATYKRAGENGQQLVELRAATGAYEHPAGPCGIPGCPDYLCTPVGGP
jgi:hypothetical protein